MVVVCWPHTHTYTVLVAVQLRSTSEPAELSGQGNMVADPAAMMAAGAEARNGAETLSLLAGVAHAQEDEEAVGEKRRRPDAV